MGKSIGTQYICSNNVNHDSINGRKFQIPVGGSGMTNESPISGCSCGMDKNNPCYRCHLETHHMQYGVLS